MKQKFFTSMFIYKNSLSHYPSTKIFKHCDNLKQFLDKFLRFDFTTEKFYMDNVVTYPASTLVLCFCPDNDCCALSVIAVATDKNL